MKKEFEYIDYFKGEIEGASFCTERKTNLEY